MELNPPNIFLLEGSNYGYAIAAEAGYGPEVGRLALETVDEIGAISASVKSSGNTSRLEGGDHSRKTAMPIELFETALCKIPQNPSVSGRNPFAKII